MQVHVVPMHCEEDGVGGKEEEPKVQQLQTLVASWGHKVSKLTKRHHLHTNRQEVLHEERPY